MAFGLPEMRGWVIFFILVNAYFLLLYVLVRKGWLTRLGMSLFGPALMIKTERGRGILDWFAKARGLFDKGAAVGVYVTALVMFLMSALLVLQLWVIFRPEIPPPSPRLILGIPGINPLIPVGYGVAALIFAVVVHEFGHGILARVHNLRVKTMGILFLIIPIGAFVEPDEDELKAAPRRHRIKVFSAGPTMNLFFALVFALLFSPVLMGAAQPVTGVPIAAVEKDGPACLGGILPGWVLTHVGATADRAAARRLESPEQLSPALDEFGPNRTVYFFVLDPHLEGNLEGHPCLNAANAQQGVFPVRTQPCALFYDPDRCRDSAPADHPDPMNRTVVGVSPYDARRVLSLLTNPVQSGPAFVTYVGLPFAALTGSFPLEGHYRAFFETPAFLPAGVFWFLASLAFWLFWINLMLGLTNALPILPLDGGYMFRDFVTAWIQGRNPHIEPERLDRRVRRISLTVAFTLLGLVLMQFVGPWIARLVGALL